MTAAERILFNRVQRRSADLDPQLAAAILRAFAKVRDSLTEAEIARALALGGEERLFQAILSQAVQDVAFQPVRERVRYGITDAVRYFGKQITASAPTAPTRALVLSFDFLNPRILDAVRVLERRVLTTLAEAIRETVRLRAEQGLREGVNPRVTAKAIRTDVGLAPNQWREVQNYRDALDGKNGRSITDYTLRDKRYDRTAKAGTLSAEQVDKMVAAYTKRRIAQHAETIARTAALNAQKLGQRLAWEDAIAKGVVDRGSLRKTWVGVMDARERPEHREMEGQTVGFDDLFLPLNQMVPGEDEYNCRCIARYSVV